jgi:hypothetical protein
MCDPTGKPVMSVDTRTPAIALCEDEASMRFIFGRAQNYEINTQREEGSLLRARTMKLELNVDEGESNAVLWYEVDQTGQGREAGKTITKT